MLRPSGTRVFRLFIRPWARGMIGPASCPPRWPAEPCTERLIADTLVSLTDGPTELQTIRDIIDWGLAYATSRPDEASFVRELGRRLADSGLQVERLSLAIIPVFADVDGKQYVWDRRFPEDVAVVEQGPGFLDSPEHRKSPQVLACLLSLDGRLLDVCSIRQSCRPRLEAV